MAAHACIWLPPARWLPHDCGGSQAAAHHSPTLRTTFISLSRSEGKGWGGTRYCLPSNADRTKWEELVGGGVDMDRIQPPATSNLRPIPVPRFPIGDLQCCVAICTLHVFCLYPMNSYMYMYVHIHLYTFNRSVYTYNTLILICSAV